MIHFDSCYLAKLYLMEPDSERVRACAEGSGGSSLSAKVFLRAADALHLTCAAEAGLRDVYSSTRHLVAAAPHFGLRAVTV